jgi:predicted HTH domain antitoxin
MMGPYILVVYVFQRQDVSFWRIVFLLFMESDMMLQLILCIV